MQRTPTPQFPPPSRAALRLIERIERGKGQLRRLRLTDETAAAKTLTGPALLDEELSEKIRAILAQ